jgi:hypothetical protein
MLVPVVAIVDGVKIEFYPDEHPPPHFHARYPNLWLRLKSGPAGFTWIIASRQTQPCAILGRPTSIGAHERLVRG